MDSEKTPRPIHLIAFLAFSHGWTWSLWAIAGTGGGSVWDWPSITFFYLGGAGVALGGVVLTRVVHGAVGLRDLGRRIIDPRPVPPRWWGVILLFYPLVAALSGVVAMQLGGVAAPLNLVNAWERLADPVGLMVMVGFVLLIGPLPEEIGWRAYLQEHLQARGAAALTAALLVGVVWWSWHLPLFHLPGYFDAFERTAPTRLDFLLNILPAAILYAWVYLGTNRSVLAVILFHFMENFTSEFLGLAEEVRPYRLGVLALAMIVVVAWNGPGTLRRSPPTK